MGKDRKARQRKEIKRVKRSYQQSASPWHVYIIECLNGTLYTGITNDLQRRLHAHQTGRGARYTRIFGVRAMVYNEEAGTRVAAMKRESEIKSWSRERKEALLNK
jgi:putative endonuclease